MLGLALLLMELSRYPILDPAVQAHYLSSYDRSGGNDDGFDGTYSALYVDAKGEQVIYWDGEEEPSVAAPLGSFFGSRLGEASVKAVRLGMSSSGPYYFEGRYDEIELSDSGRIVERSSKYAFDVPAGSSHLRLRRLFDQSTTQEAEVFVNGKRAGIWYQPGTNPHHRWGETDFLLPESLTQGAARLEVEFRVVQPGWNEFHYELWGQGRMP